MKTWTTPAAVAQEFAANDYVSACTATIDCNIPIADGFYCYRQDYGKTVIVANGVGERTFGYYTPCEATHDVSAHGELITTTMTHGYIYNPDGSVNKTPVELENPITCYVWFEHNDAGEVENVHATLTEDGFVSNKS